LQAQQVLFRMLMHGQEEEDRSAAAVREVPPLQAVLIPVQARAPQAGNLSNLRSNPQEAVFSGAWEEASSAEY
jgi:hypothetical protein